MDQLGRAVPSAAPARSRALEERAPGRGRAFRGCHPRGSETLCTHRLPGHCDQRFLWGSQNLEHRGAVRGQASPALKGEAVSAGLTDTERMPWPRALVA